MPNTPANRGTTFLKQWEANLIAQRDSVVVDAACMHCDWTLHGTVADTRAAHETHRREAHPDVKPRPRRKRDRPFGQIPGLGNLEDNIAAARAQGGATWAAPE